MGVPQNGWFTRENPNLKWMITRGTPISGSLHSISMILHDVTWFHMNLPVFHDIPRFVGDVHPGSCYALRVLSFLYAKSPRERDRFWHGPSGFHSHGGTSSYHPLTKTIHFRVSPFMETPTCVCFKKGKLYPKKMPCSWATWWLRAPYFQRKTCVTFSWSWRGSSVKIWMGDKAFVLFMGETRQENINAGWNNNSDRTLLIFHLT